MGNLLKTKWFWITGVFIVLIIAAIFGDKEDKNNRPEMVSKTETEINEASIKISKGINVSNELSSLGTWYGLSEVFLGYNGKGFGAVFDPGVPKKELYVFMAGLAYDVWGLLPSELGTPEIIKAEDNTGIITYRNSYAFLPIKDETGEKIIGASFWEIK